MQTRVEEKIYLPVDDYPDVNFMGMLIGPRGQSLKTLESETGAKVVIRGKGSVREGRPTTMPDGRPLPGTRAKSGAGCLTILSDMPLLICSNPVFYCYLYW